MHSMQKVWSPLLFATLPIWLSPHFMFFWNLLLTTLFWLYHPSEILDKHKNILTWQSFFFVFRKLKNNVTWFFFIKKHFSKQHEVEIWSKIIILNIKMIQNKNKRSKWKSCWVKSITATESMHHQWKALLTPLL